MLKNIKVDGEVYFVEAEDKYNYYYTDSNDNQCSVSKEEITVEVIPYQSIVIGSQLNG